MHDATTTCTPTPLLVLMPAHVLVRPLHHFSDLPRSVSYVAFTFVRGTSGRPRTVTLPASHAGHHTHHTTTGVKVPQTSHAKAASRRIVLISSRQTTVAATSTAVGATALSSAMQAKRIAGDCGHGCIKVKGLVRRPTSSARLKLSVAREERNMPRRRRENDLMS